MFHEGNHDKFIQDLENVFRNLTLYHVTHKALLVLDELKSYYGGDVLQRIIIVSEKLQMMLPDNHDINLLILPLLRLCNSIRKQISNSLESKSPDILHDYFVSGKFEKEIELLKATHLIQLQKIAPNYMATKVLQ